MTQFKRNNFLFVVALLFLSCTSVHAQTTIFSQDSSHLADDSNIVFTKLEIDPQFPGGLDGWGKFLRTNLDADVPVNNGAPAGTYRVMIRFIVNKDGSLRDIQPETNFGYGLEKEALRVLKLSPNWIPGKQNGYVVNAYKRQPITFIVMNTVRSNFQKTNNITQSP